MPRVIFNKRAQKELGKAPSWIIKFFRGTINTLQKRGQLDYKTGKRISKELFEIRLTRKEQWRAIYTYLENESIAVLIFFKKKTQKTPKKIIKIALQRRNLAVETYKEKI